LVVVLASGQGRQFLDIWIQPICLIWKIHLPILNDAGYGMHAHDLVRGRFVTSNAVLIRTLREKVTIIENGKRKTVTKFDAAMKQLANKAAAGDLRASQQLFSLARLVEGEMNSDKTPVLEIGDLDRQVMEGILKRFQPASEPEPAGER
jgi:Family of unknown function (DUF5681)